MLGTAHISTIPKTITGLLLVTCLFASGCGGSTKRHAEPFGKIFYLDGAGNLGFGTSEVPRGLQKAGYQGDVEVFVWTSSLNPLIDQLNILGAANSAGKRLASRIKAYKKKYPRNPVHVIALSAGTGVAVWACENLDYRNSIDNLVLLGSSLSYNYDAAKALNSVRKNVWVYHSPRDSILGTVEIVGTIDRRVGVKSAGQVGLKPPRGAIQKIVNIPWSQTWSRLGWHGGHTDCTNEKFVRYEIAQRILGPMERVRRTTPRMATTTPPAHEKHPESSS